MAECLQGSLQEELILEEDGWQCQNCACPSEAKKTLVINRYPDVLVVHLKSFQFENGRVKKIEEKIGVPSTMRVGEKNTKYDLVGVVKHSGNRQSGHYVAEVETSHTWFLCNDANTTKIRRDNMVWCRKAYLLFYQIGNKSTSI